MNIVEFSHITKRFEADAKSHDDTAPAFAVKDLSLSIADGELVAVVGKTGCGKSTMFNLLIGLIAPTSGTINVLGKDPFADFRALAGKVGVVFQNDRLLPWRTALDNVGYGLELRKVDKRVRARLALEWLAKLGLEAHADKYPQILLCDEPFSALDEITGATLRNEFRRLVKETNKTGVLVTHSIREAMDVGDRILVLRSPGHVAAQFEVQSMLADVGEARLKKLVLEAMGDTGQGSEPAPVTPLAKAM